MDWNTILIILFLLAIFFLSVPLFFMCSVLSAEKNGYEFSGNLYDAVDETLDYIEDSFTWFEEELDKIITDTVEDISGALLGGVKGLFNDIVDTWQEGWSEIVATWQEGWSEIVSTWKVFWGDITYAWTVFWGDITGTWTTLMSGIPSLSQISNTWKTEIGDIYKTLDGFANDITSFADSIITDVTNLDNKINNDFVNLFNYIVGEWKFLWGQITAQWHYFVDKMDKYFYDAWDVILLTYDELKYAFDKAYGYVIEGIDWFVGLF